MLYLVRFIEDGLLYICNAGQIKNKKDASNIKQVRYKHHGIFKAEIISSSEDINILNKMLNQLNNSKTTIREDLAVSSIENCGGHDEVSSFEPNNNSAPKMSSSNKKHQVSDIQIVDCYVKLSALESNFNQTQEISTPTEKQPEENWFENSDPFNSSDSIADRNFVPDHIDSSDNEEINNEMDLRDILSAQSSKEVDLNSLGCALLRNNDEQNWFESSHPFNSSDSIADPNFMPDQIDSSDNEERNRETEKNEILSAQVNDNNTNFGKVNLNTIRRTLFKSNDKNNTTNQPKRDLKKYCCIFCNKLVCKIVRHYETIHKDEKDIKTILSLPKGCSERRDIINKLRKDGNFTFSKNNSEVIPCRRAQKTKPRNSSYFKPCPNCKGYYSKLSLRKHVLKCSDNCIRGQKNTMADSRRIEEKTHKKASKVLKEEVIPVMRDDEVTNLIKYDELLIIYGNKMCIKYKSKHHYPMIRARLRLVGRFLMELRKNNNSITDFSSVFEPRYYDDAVNSINKVAKLNESEGKYGAPSTAFALGTALKVVANILIFESIKKEDDKKHKLVTDFLKLMIEDFALSINKTVEENMSEAKRHKVVVLPTSNDIQLLIKFLTKNRKDYYKQLDENGFTFKTWKCFASFTLISLQVFNRRRPGEIERATIADFENFETLNENANPDIFNSLALDSQLAVKRYARFTIRGKKGRNVPVLLHVDLIKCVKVIISYRKEARVPEKNPYIFGLPSQGTEFKYLRAVPLLREYSKQCGAINPTALRATELRKHIATQAVLLNLQGNEVSDLANFMGHADSIHKKHYRIPIAAREIAQISRLLELAQGRDIIDDDSSDDEIIETEISNKEISENLQQTTNKFKRKTEPVVGTIKRKTWTTPEKSLARTIFADRLQEGKVPNIKDCEYYISKHQELKERTPAQLKLWVHNQVVKKQKKLHTSLKSKKGKQGWETPERHAAKEAFESHLKLQKLPTISECEEAIEKYSPLKNRTPPILKSYINNEIRRQKKYCLSKSF